MKLGYMHGLAWCMLGSGMPLHAHVCMHAHAANLLTQFLSLRMPMEPHCCLQEEMYSFVTVADDQTTKGKGTTIVQDA